MKYKCPKCGSTDIFYWKECVKTTHYKIKQDGEPYKRPYETRMDIMDNEGLECDTCGNILNTICGIDDAWIDGGR